MENESVTISIVSADRTSVDRSPMRVELAQSHETSICRDHVRRLEERMGGCGRISEKEGLSQGDPLHQKYPYLLRGLRHSVSNQVWGSGFTYVKLEQLRLSHGHPRLVQSICGRLEKVSPTLRNRFLLKHSHSNCNTDIWNTDQGGFTGRDLHGLRPSARRRNQYGWTAGGWLMDNILAPGRCEVRKIFFSIRTALSLARTGIGDPENFYNNKTNLLIDKLLHPPSLIHYQH